MEQVSNTTDAGSEQSASNSRLLEAGWYVIGFLAFLALGIANLFYPFGDDQAVLFFAAKELDQGARLYVEYWGNKQPGLYAFYLLACQLFGFTEFGVHLLELIWFAVFAVILMVTLRPYFQARWLSAVVPLATIGVYYATALEDELTQLEILVAFPLYLTAWSALQALEPSKREGTSENEISGKRMVLLFFFSGLTAAVATLFKLLLAPIAVAFWLIASFYLLREHKVSLIGLLLRVWTPVAVGVVLPFCAVVFWFWQHSALQELFWTSFIYPPEALFTSPPASKTRLVTAAAFMLTNLAPWLLFVVVAIVACFRKQAPRMVTLLLAWILLAGGLFLIQRFSWWPYHTLLLFTPLGILAVFGIDKVAAYVGRFVDFGLSQRSGWLGRTAIPAMVCTALFAIPPTASLTGPFLAKARVLISETMMAGGGLMAYHWKVNPNYKRIFESGRFLTEPGARPGPIYSFGSAMIYPFTGRDSAHKTAGFSWEFYVPSQIRDILASLEEKQVPYVFVERASFRLFRRRPEAAAYLTANYKRIKKDDGGVWYERLP
ncbi:glycosyltransferase family 39 protein [Pelagibius sp. Alg239-R121]|uniref:ArnT family glycosyltransferase n=1 Tax=Pelagibius sp. Alg239-R121 TaxID=2993448 RepID=UPI0024A65DDC|nr:hypothetical protein [Pelagibius sp. Alg239-R121]